MALCDHFPHLTLQQSGGLTPVSTSCGHLSASSFTSAVPLWKLSSPNSNHFPLQINLFPECFRENVSYIHTQTAVIEVKLRYDYWPVLIWILSGKNLRYMQQTHFIHQIQNNMNCVSICVYVLLGPKCRNSTKVLAKIWQLTFIYALLEPCYVWQICNNSDTKRLCRPRNRDLIWLPVTKKCYKYFLGAYWVISL